MKLLTTLALAFTLSTQAAEKPNVLIILADDLGFSDLSCYGGEIPTPNLDQLATGGAKFSAFYTSARCCPSRASLMTGIHPHQAGIGSFTHAKQPPGKGLAYKGQLLPTCATLGEMLLDQGYSTWAVGKWHMAQPGPIHRGFQHYYGYKNFLAHSENQWDPSKYVRLPEGTTPELLVSEDFYVTDVFTDYSLEFLKQARRQKDKPWFLYLAHSSPHFPIQAPKESIDRHVEIYRKGWDVLRAERFERQKKLGLVKPDAKLPPLSEVPVDRDDIANGFSGKPNPAWDSLPADRREDLARRMATFAAMVEHIDLGVGRIIEDLKKNGEFDNTIIAFLSDNGACYEWGPFGFDGRSRRGTTTLHQGEVLANMGQADTHSSYGSGWANLGNTPLNMYKHFCHEGGLTSPLILHWPKGIQPVGHFVKTPSHLMDIVPTVLEATGGKYPAERKGYKITPVEGTSLLPALTDDKAIPDRVLAFEHQEARGLRKGDWKLVWGKRQPDEVTWELYNLAEDRFEQNNVAQNYATIRDQLIKDWNNWAKRVHAAPHLVPEPGYQKEAPKPSGDSPKIAKRPLVIKAKVEGKNLSGVVLAQGGREQGFALHFVNGMAVFDVRVNGEVTRLSSTLKAEGIIDLEARITPRKLVLRVNGKAFEKPSPGLIPVQPKDPLSIAKDDLTAAGNYYPPNAFSGKVRSHSVKPAKEKDPTSKINTPGEEPNGLMIRDQSAPSPVKKPPLKIPVAQVAPVRPVDSRETIEAGLKSHDRALFIKNDWIRDPYITRGPDDFYYLTGTTINEEDPREETDPYNIGLSDHSAVGTTVRVWKSKDLIDWTSLGAIYSLKDSYHQEPGDRIWAPEVHWIPEMNQWALVHCPKRKSNFALSAGPELKGPWTHPMGNNLRLKHDPSLYKDGDTWWMLSENTNVHPLADDFSKFTAAATRIDPSSTRPNPDGGKPISRIGHEGATMMKVGGKYVHLGTAWSTDSGRQGSYNLYYCVADKITGPYGPRKFAGRFLGHGTPFQTRDGKWWCTAFFNANVPPLSDEGIQTRDLSETAQTINHRGTTIVPLDVRVLKDGEIYIRAKDPRYANPGPDEAQKFE
ncbi:MAG: sulfatase-like hydrolase/transferase [Akkermansiaceae bacterium]